MLLVGVAFIVEPQAEVADIVFRQEGAEETVPEGEHAAVVGVVLVS